jgi:metal-responsive CopG/Arc/MetJ family transcriptional regulator
MKVKVETLGEIFRARRRKTNSHSHLNIRELRKLSETEFELEVTYTSTITVKLPTVLMEKLERIAKEQKVTKSDLIRSWVHSFLALTPAEQDVIVNNYCKGSLGEIKVLGIRLVQEVLNELDEIARRNDVSRSDVLRSIMVFKSEIHESS